MNVDVRPDDVEQPRHDVDLHVEALQPRDELDGVLVRLGRERDHHPLDIELLDQLGQIARPAQDALAAEVVSQDARAAVDEPDEIDAVLGMLEELAADELADVAGADDECVLDVRAAAAAERSSEQRGR